VGQKSPLRLKEIWAIRIRLQIAKRVRDLALFNLAIDSKLRSCDLLKLKVRDVSHGNLPPQQGDDPAAENPPASTVRNYLTNAEFNIGMDFFCKSRQG
jgi:hypothetical protein